ncbi:MAG: metal ABC transporter substrate-binding protein, partial [Bacillota bacterium]|nr:metal ABC transporter substrate-binding protein [Bacillota bacterium]
AAQEFVNGYVKAGAQAETKSDTVKSISTKFMSVDSKVLDLSLKWISYNNLKINENDYKELSNSLVEMGLSKNPPKYDDFVDNTLIDNVKK